MVKCPLNARLDFSGFPGDFAYTLIGGIAPNEVIARSEVEVHRQIYTE